MKSVAKYIFLSGMFFLLSVRPAYAGTVQALTWQECIKEALKNHPDLVASVEKLKQAKADKAITKSAILPQINSELSAKRAGTTTKSAATGVTSSNVDDTYSYVLTGKQLLFDGFKTSNDLGAASETIKASEYDYAVTSSDVRLSLKTAFTGLLRAKELLSITADIASRRKQNLELVKLRYEAGREHEGSLLTAEADLAQAEFEVQQAKRNFLLAQRQLVKELGWEKFTEVEAKGNFEISDTDRSRPDFESLADNTPFLKELIAKKEAARFGLKSAKADFFPQVYLNGSLGNSAEYWPPDQKQWSATLSLSFPIFEGGSRIAQVSKAKAELKQAKADKRSGRDSVLFTLEQAWKEFQDAIDKVSVQGKYLRAVEKRAKISSAQYSTGLISFDDWIIIEDSLVDTKKSYLDSRANMLVAEASWIQAKGGILKYEW